MATRVIKKDRRALALVRFAGDTPQCSSNVPRQIKLRVGTKLLPLTHRLAETIRLRADTEDPDVLEAEVYRTFRDYILLYNIAFMIIPFICVT